MWQVRYLSWNIRSCVRGKEGCCVRRHILSEAEIGRLATAPVYIVRRITPGFATPAELSAEQWPDVRGILTKRPAATLFCEMSDEAMCPSGLYLGDVLVVDRSVTPAYGDVVVAQCRAELVARHFCPEPQGLVLMPSSDEYLIIRGWSVDCAACWAS
jgi:DNA polymerase V